MTEIPRFSPWCQLCLDGDNRIDAHARHVLQLKRERAARPSKLQWRVEKTEPPAPGKWRRGRVSPSATEEPHEPEERDQQATHPEGDEELGQL